MTLDQAIRKIQTQASLDDLRTVYYALIAEFSGDQAAIWAVQEATCAAKEQLTPTKQ